MSREQLIEQYLRLARKLAMVNGTWHSGRIDRLASAFHAVEQELRARQINAPAHAA